MKATYDSESKTYTITGMPREVAHVLIWGGYTGQEQRAQALLRNALVDAEDTQMSANDYDTMISTEIARV